MTTKPTDKQMQRWRKAALRAAKTYDQIVPPTISINVAPLPVPDNQIARDLDQELRGKIIRKLLAGKVIEAIVVCRQATNLSLRDAKAVIDHIRGNDLATRH